MMGERRTNWIVLNSLSVLLVRLGVWLHSVEKEKKKTLILTRVVSGFAIFFAFIYIIYLGHYPTLSLVVLIQVGSISFPVA